MPPPDDAKSVHEEGLKAALVHRWIQSEKAGHDLGEPCIRKWVHEHWNGFLRARWMEHLEGKTYWMELHGVDYGVLQNEFAEDKELLDRIMERMKEGKENLEIINWALDWGLPMRRVMHILERLNLNSTKLSCQFCSTDVI